ncbi:hypothetical protein [Aliagarivorans marinus]|uniref:hypothetical protein n=1 Tax=Aliagarivorans marinus TaxID=561965 RepID=UPI000412E73B|nr:hypothetical protein [Aliagarivorans marinus]
MEEIESQLFEKSVDEVLAELKEERAALHPDKNGGKFRSNKEEERYHFISEAITHINEKNSSNQMIPVSQLPVIIESISKSLAVQNNPPAIVEKNLKESFRSDLGRKYMAPKVGSGIFAAVTGFLFTQSSTLIEHPVLGTFFNSVFGFQLLGIGFLVSVGLFLVYWMQERREEAQSTYLLSEDALHDIYHMMERESENGLVELHRIRRFYTRSHRPGFGPMNILFSPRLSPQVVDQILEVQLNRLVERKAIEQLERPGIDKVYKLNA